MFTLWISECLHVKWISRDQSDVKKNATLYKQMKKLEKSEKTKVKNNNFVELKIPKKYWTCIKHISDTKQKHNK